MAEGANGKARRRAARFWIVAGVMHFVAPRYYEGIVPERLEPWKREIVVASGVAELTGGLAVIPSSTRRAARWWLLATLLAVYPANVEMALRPQRYAQIPPALLWARLPFQGLFAWWTWRGTE